jgi:ketosteroid isomerase-like protein
MSTGPRRRVVGAISLPIGQHACVAMRFESDEVAAAAKSASVADALAARAALDEAFAAQDIDRVAALCADDLVVNTPGNRVARREQVLGFFGAGLMNYEDAEETIECLDGRGDLVVIMGSEVVRPRESAAHAGRTVNRRFTDVWRKDPDGRWRLTIRQGTIISID